MKINTLILILTLFWTNIFAQNADINILKDINLNRNTQLDGVFITDSATPVSFGIPIALLGIGLLKKDSTLKQNAWNIGTAVMVSVAISTALKYTTNRDRPFITYPFIQKLTEGGSPSFPSGHTTEAFALATSLSMAYPKWYVIAPSFVWASAVGYSRLDLGVHYPSDVLAGAILGSGSAYLSYKLNKWINKKYTSKKHHSFL
jgi:membrane-associated phospholipid phosphatase